MAERTWRTALLMAVLWAVIPAWGQRADSSPPSFGSLLNVDALVDNYLHFVSRKYELTADQDAYTEQLVRTKVDEFMSRHHDEVTDLVNKLVSARNGTELSPDELMDWGRRMQPLYDEAKDVILQTNDQWRGILSEKQLVIHDEDVKLMHESFTTTEDQLARLATGQMTLEEFRNPKRARDARQRAPTPIDMPLPTSGGGAKASRAGRSGDATADSGARDGSAARRGRSGAGGTDNDTAGHTRRDGSTDAAGRKGRAAGGAAKGSSQIESQWEQYVRQFIEKYALTSEQKAQAEKILKACQEQAQRYMRSKADLLEKLDRQAAALKGDDAQAKAKELADINAQKSKLLAPIDEIFEKQLKPRLDRIPTRTQREAGDKAGTKLPTPKAESATPSAGGDVRKPGSRRTGGHLKPPADEEAEAGEPDEPPAEEPVEEGNEEK